MGKNLTKIAIVGSIGLESSALKESIIEALKKKNDIIVINQEPGYDLEIQGIKYRRLGNTNRQIGSIEQAAAHMLNSNIYTPYFEFGQQEKTPMPRVHIEAEFKLIQNKSSKLSKRERKWVVSEFNKMYQKVI